MAENIFDTNLKGKAMKRVTKIPTTMISTVTESVYDTLLPTISDIK